MVVAAEFMQSHVSERRDNLSWWGEREREK